eukprot:6120170-Pyramimonas_sp.AAC.1
MPFAAWWTKIGKKKSTDQWKRKCKTLGATDGQLDHEDVTGVGALLYQHLDCDGEWTETPMQQAPAAA